MSATDRFSAFSSGLDSPATEILEILPDDAAELPQAVRALNVAGAGTLRVETVAGSIGSVYLAAGGVFPLRVRRVFATGTDATGITGLI